MPRSRRGAPLVVSIVATLVLGVAGDRRAPPPRPPVRGPPVTSPGDRARRRRQALLADPRAQPAALAWCRSASRPHGACGRCATSTCSIEPGETVGMIGRNGAGKTTLLRLLAGVAQPTTGTVAVRGRVAPLLSVGVGFHQEMTGRENVYVNGDAARAPRSRRSTARFDEIVEFAELADFIDTPVKFYSSGMFMRLGFSVADPRRARRAPRRRGARRRRRRVPAPAASTGCANCSAAARRSSS